MVYAGRGLTPTDVGGGLPSSSYEQPATLPAKSVLIKSAATPWTVLFPPEPNTGRVYGPPDGSQELACDRWYVLSAKHGLLHPDTVVEPYDMRLGTNDRTSPPIHSWAAGVQEQMAAELAGLENVTLVVLAGEQYRTILRDSPWPSEVPMKGLGIGQQVG